MELPKAIEEKNLIFVLKKNFYEKMDCLKRATRIFKNSLLMTHDLLENRRFKINLQMLFF